MGKGDYVDITEWTKRGLVKLPNSKTDNLRVDKEGYVELADPGSMAGISQSSEEGANFSNPVNATSSPMAGFFDNLGTNSGSSNPIFQENSNQSSQLNNTNEDANALKLKIDDLEFKLERLTEKLEEISIKLLNFESKTNN